MVREFANCPGKRNSIPGRIILKTQNKTHNAWPSLCHQSLSSIAPDKSSRLHPISAQSCCI